jgi:translation elongation factor P/translation initiation factor 5A
VTTPRRGPKQAIAARDLKTGDYITSRKWNVMKVEEVDGGESVRISVTRFGRIRQKTFKADKIFEVARD